MRIEGKIRKAAFNKLVHAFIDDIIPVLEKVEFKRSIFSSHPFGEEGKDFVFTFVSLQSLRLLDLVYFEIRYEELSIRAFYNRIRLDQDTSDLSVFSGKVGLSLLLMPFRKTEKEIHRWVPIPFVKIPKSYSLEGRLSEENVEKAIEKTISELANDLKHFDIIRSEWNDEHDAIELPVAELE